MRWRERGRALAWVLAAGALAAWVEVLLRVSSLSKAAQVLGVEVGTGLEVGAFHQEPLPRWGRVRLRAVDVVASHWPWGDTCLRRSLMTAVVLHRLHPVLRVGWLTTPSGGNAHAWVEVGGRSLESGLEDVRPFEFR